MNDILKGLKNLDNRLMKYPKGSKGKFEFETSFPINDKKGNATTNHSFDWERKNNKVVYTDDGYKQFMTYKKIRFDVKAAISGIYSPQTISGTELKIYSMMPKTFKYNLTR